RRWRALSSHASRDSIVRLSGGRTLTNQNTWTCAAVVTALRNWITSPWTKLKWLQLVFWGLTLVSIGLGFQNAVGGQQAASLAGISFLVGVILPYLSGGLNSAKDAKSKP